MAFAKLSDDDVDAIYAKVAEAGYCRVDGLFPPATLGEARQQAEAAIDANGGQYVSFIGPSGHSGDLLAGLQADPDFRAFCARLYERAAGSAAPGEGFHQVLRCLKGETGRSNSWYLHFDSYVVTTLIPLAIPDTGASGDLILLRRRRAIRRFYLTGVVEKALFDRKPIQRALWWLIRRGVLKSTRLRLDEGALYIFLGYRTLHANEPCDADKLRATLLLHYGNPHEHSRGRAWIGRWRGGWG